MAVRWFWMLLQLYKNKIVCFDCAIMNHENEPSSTRLLGQMGRTEGLVEHKGP